MVYISHSGNSVRRPKEEKENNHQPQNNEINKGENSINESLPSIIYMYYSNSWKNHLQHSHKNLCFLNVL